MRGLLAAGTSLILLSPALGQAPPVRGPNIPLMQPRAPQVTPATGGYTAYNPIRTPPPGVLTGPGTTIYTPTRSYYGRPGSTYIINNYNSGVTNSPFGYPSGGFTGMTAPSGQFYSVLGGPAPSNPFISNVPPTAQTWPGATGVGANGQPWSYPFNYYNFNNPPQFPAIVGAPIVGQSTGLFPQPPAVPPGAAVGGAAAPNFGVQGAAGLNAFGNPK